MKSEQLLSCIKELQKLECVQKSNGIQQNLKHIENRIHDNEFKVVVVGEFSTGKSTFINAILGQDVLSHSVEETTATVTYIHNVPHQDPRENSCQINYRSGIVKTISKLSELTHYTTAQSQNHVAEEISSVDVYVHFLNAKDPITIIDTPGLNGVADMHREITIEEIQKAHACIYLLSLKGISNSDIDFLKVLQKYQNQFIFIQNFRDALKIEEGESSIQKITEIKKILEEKFPPQKSSIKYPNPICISALQALVAKDTNISSLYENGKSLTAEDRKILLKNSNFSEFEKCLTEILNSGEYKKIVLSSAKNALLQIVDILIQEETPIANAMNQLLKIHAKAKQNDLIENRINQLENNKKIYEQKLENFVIARKSDNSRVCRNFITEQIENARQHIWASVDISLKSYEDIEDFSEKHRGKKLGEYFSKESTNYSKNIKTDLDQRIQELLQEIYTVSILQAKRYNSTQTSSNPESYSPVIELSNSKITDNKLDFRSEKEKIAQKENQVIQKNIEKKNKLLDQQEARSKETQIQCQIDEENRLYQKQKNRNNNVGKKPEFRSWYTTETRTKEVYRGGFGLFDKLFGPKIETYEERIYHDNSDEISAWERKNNSRRLQKQQEEETHERKIRELERKKRNLEALREKNKNQAQRIQQQIDQLNDEIREDKELLEFNEKHAKNELLNITKNELKKQIQQQFECVESNMITYTEEIFENNIQNIQSLVKKAYLESTEARIDELQKIIKGNTSELEKKYRRNESTLRKLHQIQSDINQ